ncbi:UDP-N-acetylglucosamine--N-acetylmuramyl-(pentapeptide) pyrophosphoryl-undecaprenol N-acetylglucosamine transferase [Geodia barretti]|uniref:UDP-N-acetylglucosamine--N-acetylmuramyl-(Pentape ptide) pyrophosphoryl-undecaprenol N-acetylglucosamine transferase n=1 Tax=Geodia barretti TaxID=519541 RepID=A0AA35TS49_GEOBA|nr:UDP-N-acetylglucosamine--N-acetylmuramyl-(pentapeptide) pyrophosphoryl-undecaprenol N-acetylglucosamine transferase [Geodia barretti]
MAGVERSYGEAGVEARLALFFEDMPARLGEAHLVICRAGASTIAELAAAGRPAILVPLPIAADDHQSANGRAMVAAGAAIMIAQSSFTSARLAQELETLMVEPAELARRAAAAQSFAKPDAAHALADLVEGLIGGPSPEPATSEPVGGAA